MRPISLTRALALSALLVASPALAAETGGCEKFAWPIADDQALLARADMVESGATVDVVQPKAVRVVMAKADRAGFEVAPTRPPAPDAPGGTVRFEAEAGLYQFTVTERVWIDVAQDGKALQEVGFSGVRDCEGARKSVRFELDDGPAVVQLSGSPTRTVAISITRAPKDAPK